MSEFIMFLYALGYVMVGIFAITILYHIMDGKSDVDGVYIFFVIVWPVIVGIMVLLGLLVAPYYLANFIVGKLKWR